MQADSSNARSLSVSGASDFQYLTKAEVEELGFPNGVFWSSDELDLIGGTLALPMTETTLQKSDASDVSFMSSLCSGDFASQAKAVSSSSAEQREVSGFCIEGNDTSQFVAIKTKVGDEVLYNVLFFGSEASANPTGREEVTGNIALRSASFVVER